jgi:hypothetical protein
MKEFTRRGLIFGAATVAASALLLGVQRIASSAFAGGVNPQDDPGPVKIARNRHNCEGSQGRRGMEEAA